MTGTESAPDGAVTGIGNTKNRAARTNFDVEKIPLIVTPGSFAEMGGMDKRKYPPHTVNLSALRGLIATGMRSGPTDLTVVYS